MRTVSLGSFVLALFLGGAALATDVAPDSLTRGDKPPFEALMDLFSSGTTTTMAATAGGYSGRCFLPKNNVAYGDLLVADLSNEAGPLFPKRPFLWFFGGPYFSARYFDEYQRSTIGSLTGAGADYAISETEGYLQSVSKRAGTELRVKRNGDYLVSLFVCNKAGADCPLGAVNPYVKFACYYYSKLW